MSTGRTVDYLRHVRVSGPDARAYLQSQLTRDMAATAPGHWHPAAWCDPKGRVLSFMLLRVGEGGVDLILPGAGIETVHQRLSMYTIGRSASLAAPQPVVGGYGPADRPGATPMAADTQRWLAPAAGAEDIPDTDPEWLAADIRAGLPWILPATAGHFLPQFLGLEYLDGISHAKGCYPGQEVIARLYHRGKIKRTLTGFRAARTRPPEPGTVLDDQQGHHCGKVLLAAATGGHTLGLAVVRVELGAGTPVRIDGDPAYLTPLESL